MCVCGDRSVKEDEPPKAIVLAERVVASAVHSMQLDNAVRSLPCTVSSHGIAGAAHCSAWQQLSWYGEAAGRAQAPAMPDAERCIMLSPRPISACLPCLFALNNEYSPY